MTNTATADSETDEKNRTWVYVIVVMTSTLFLGIIGIAMLRKWVYHCLKSIKNAVSPNPTEALNSNYMTTELTNTQTPDFDAMSSKNETFNDDLNL